MTKIVWEGIPEQFWPDTEKPWRITWGIGAFKDFVTSAEAEAYREHLLETLTGDWRSTVR
jgi:hypothetical protein